MLFLINNKKKDRVKKKKNSYPKKLYSQITHTNFTYKKKFFSPVRKTSSKNTPGFNNSSYIKNNLKLKLQNKNVR